MEELIYDKLIAKYVDGETNFIFKLAFLLYDKYVFQNQIRNKFLERKYIITIDDQDISCAALVVKKGDRINWFHNLSRINDFYGDDFIRQVMTITKYSCIYMTMILWNQMEFSMKYNYRLFRCVAKIYFPVDDDYVKEILKEIKIAYEPAEILSLPLNWSASCYLDSLMIAMFLSDNYHYKKNILYSNVKPLKPLVDNEIVSVDEFAKNVKNEFLRLFTKFTTFEGSLKCKNIRSLLADYLPDLKPYRSYGVSEVYDIITDIFPKTKISIPLSNGNKLDVSSIMFWDYISQDDSISWNKINSGSLVFRNGFVPLIKNAGNKKDEITDGMLIEKQRIFKQEIEFQETYSLTAAVMHHGSRNEGRGGHYTAYVKRADNWYEYDDTGPYWTSIDGLPDDIFKDTGKSRPELLFYSKKD